MTDLKFVNIITQQGFKQPIKLMLSTPSGRIREVPLSDKDVANLLLFSAHIAATRTRNDPEGTTQLRPVPRLARKNERP